MSGLEVIGAVASIASLVHLTGKVFIQSCEYIGAVKEAESEIKKLTDELGALSKVLKILEGLNSTTLCELKDPLQGCTSELKTLQSKLSAKPKGRFRTWAKRLKWPLQEKETLHVISQIERFKSLFTLALTADHL